MNEAMQTIWHKAYEKALQTITSLRNHCDFKYEGDSRNAKEVKVLNAYRPTVKAYVPGTKIDREYIDATACVIPIDKFFYFNIGIDDIKKAQSVPGALEASAEEGSIALTEQGDTVVADTIKAAVTSGDVHALTAKTLSKSNCVEFIEEGFKYLYEKNCKVSEAYHLEVCPKFFTFTRQNLTELFTNNVEMAKKGYIGKYGNALVSIENLLAKDSEGNIQNLLRTTHAVAFIEQVRKVEAYRPHDGFEDALKGLYACGAKVVRKDEIVVLPTTA